MLAVGALPGISPGLPVRHAFWGQEGHDGRLQHVGVPADRVAGVTVVRARPVKTQVARCK
jgi:hypothetical protein